PPPKNVRLDLRKANRAQLLAAGLADKNIFVSDLCTACHPDLLFSYRKEADRSGRLLSVIGLRKENCREHEMLMKHQKLMKQLKHINGRGPYTRDEMNER
ncbi:MAG TPA: laccase domain-containing protein, partial [Candidatus Acidoferrum sp.]|nr:laccase domain-containing protein [Candidatus Acidoferrum sp.]